MQTMITIPRIIGRSLFASERTSSQPVPGSVNTVSMNSAPANATPTSMPIAKDVLPHHAETARALRARCTDVVLLQRLEQAGPDHPRVERREEEGKGQPRQDHVVGPVARPAAEARAFGLVVEVAIPADRKPVQLHTTHVREDEPHPDRVRRGTYQNEQHQPLV